MTPIGDDANPVADPLAEDAPSKEGGLGVGGSSYVPPHLRKGAAAGGDKMGGKYERDDLATLRVTNVGAPPYLQIAVLTTHRYQKWQKKTTFDKYSSTSAASPEFSSPKIEKQAGLRALHSYRSWIGPMQRGRVKSWMALATNISS